MRMIDLVLLSLLTVFSSCAGVSVLAQEKNQPVLYQQSFLKKIDDVRELQKKGKYDKALKSLKVMKDEQLLISERGLKANLIGVILFGQKKYGDAKEYFQKAKANASEDKNLRSKVNLNLASTLVRLGNSEEGQKVLKECDPKELNDSEAKKYHALTAELANFLGTKEETAQTMLSSFIGKADFASIKSAPNYENFKIQFLKLSSTERVRLAEEVTTKSAPLASHLYFLTAKAEQAAGNLEQAKKIAEKALSLTPDESLLVAEMDSFNVPAIANNSVSAIEFQEEIDLTTIGVVLPLSGEKKALGDRVLAGIDLALKDQGKSFKYELRDSAGSAEAGSKAVEELITKFNVAVVVGGLTSAEAIEEYKMAQKKGVVFISLSQMAVESEQKGFQLVELMGSVESQMKKIFDLKSLEIFGGKRASILYPKTDLGSNYANSFFEASKENSKTTTLISFDPKTSEFQEPVKNFLGIKFERERSEELSLVRDISNLEKNKNNKRLQNLQPQIDFDFVFLPALPKETLQILPLFNFYDTHGVSYVGNASWRSEIMAFEAYRFGKVFFVEDSSGPMSDEFIQKYQTKFGQLPKLTEKIGYDSILITETFLKEASSSSSRRDFNGGVEKLSELKGASGIWRKGQLNWLKDMSLIQIKKEGMETVEL